MFTKADRVAGRPAPRQMARSGCQDGAASIGQIPRPRDCLPAFLLIFPPLGRRRHPEHTQPVRSSVRHPCPSVSIRVSQKGLYSVFLSAGTAISARNTFLKNYVSRPFADTHSSTSRTQRDENHRKSDGVRPVGTVRRCSARPNLKSAIKNLKSQDLLALFHPLPHNRCPNLT